MRLIGRRADLAILGQTKKFVGALRSVGTDGGSVHCPRTFLAPVPWGSRRNPHESRSHRSYDERRVSVFPPSARGASRRCPKELSGILCAACFLPCSS